MTLTQDLLTIPAYILFHLTWLLHHIRRPLLLVSILCILSNPQAAIRKTKLVYMSLLYLVLCKDKKWKVPKDDPAIYFTQELGGNRKESATTSTITYKEKTVILIRHGESTWNDTFNPGDRNKVLFVVLFIPNLIYAIVVEVYFFVAGKDSESWFFDSALSAKGVRQSEGLRKFLKKEKMRLGSNGQQQQQYASGEEKAIQLLLSLNESTPSSHVVSSNLRRAISTAAIGLADRFASSIEKSTEKDTILLLPCLQEISRNPDALSILPPRGVAHPTWCDTNIPGVPASSFSSMVDTKLHTGNKSLKSNGILRLNQFCADIFDQSKLPKSTVIAAGHSLFFRSMFQVFLPRGVEHIGKKKKIVNGGVVMFTLREATVDKRKEYMIDPSSVVVVYGGFGKHTKG
jgi:hypothetical protein